MMYKETISGGKERNTSFSNWYSCATFDAANVLWEEKRTNSQFSRWSKERKRVRFGWWGSPAWVLPSNHVKGSREWKYSTWMKRKWEGVDGKSVFALHSFALKYTFSLSQHFYHCIIITAFFIASSHIIITGCRYCVIILTGGSHTESTVHIVRESLAAGEVLLQRVQPWEKSLLSHDHHYVIRKQDLDSVLSSACNLGTHFHFRHPNHRSSQLCFLFLFWCFITSSWLQFDSFRPVITTEWEQRVTHSHLSTHIHCSRFFRSDPICLIFGCLFDRELFVFAIALAHTVSEPQFIRKSVFRSKQITRRIERQKERDVFCCHSNESNRLLICWPDVG